MLQCVHNELYDIGLYNDEKANDDQKGRASLNADDLIKKHLMYVTPKKNKRICKKIHISFVEAYECACRSIHLPNGKVHYSFCSNHRKNLL